ncbi:MAG: hypothetical protein HC886_13725 [Leptolyngbyaceae cyanobacterium SM1_1_3]|nr:hypothetical protein [Leptolyngbyaceae cyanobacterium SM1_1_3]
MRRLLQDETRRVYPWVIITYDFKRGETEPSQGQIRKSWQSAATASRRDESFPLGTDFAVVYRDIERLSALNIQIKQLHFLTHFSDDAVRYRVGGRSSTSDLARVNQANFAAAFARDTLIKIHGCQQDRDVTRAISEFCQDSTTTARRTEILRAIRSRLQRSYPHQLARLIERPVWAAPLGAYSIYACSYLPRSERGRRFCVESGAGTDHTFQRTLRFYQANYGQFFLRSREAIFDATWHLQYKSALQPVTSLAPVPCATRLLPGGISRAAGEADFAVVSQDADFADFAVDAANIPVFVADSASDPADWDLVETTCDACLSSGLSFGTEADAEFPDPQDLSASLPDVVELAEAAIAANPAQPSIALLEAVLDSDSGALHHPLGVSASSPLALFEAFKPDGIAALQRHFEQWFEVVATPGESVRGVQAGDLLVRRALGEGSLAHLAMLATGEVIGAETLYFEGLTPESQRPGLYAQVIEAGAFPQQRQDGFARRLADTSGRLGPSQVILRLRSEAIAPLSLAPAAYLQEWDLETDSLSNSVVHQCRAGEGPPAAVPDPEGRGLHPLIYSGTSQRRSRNPSVGDAQQLLNRFLSRRQNGLSICPARSPEVQQYIAQGRAALQRNSQYPLIVDCRFGTATATATKMFQACQGLTRDGKIGPDTWGQLVQLRTVPPVPVPPVPVPPVPPAIVLNPPRWAPIIRSRLSSSATLRSGNAVTFLVDGAATFRAMVDAINTVQSAEHYVYLLGWILKDNFEMIPCDRTSSFSNLIAAASSRGVQVRAMLWDQVGTQNTAEVGRINALPTGAAILDNETPSPIAGFGSHHQKVLIVKGAQGLITFCGGIDINDDRIDPCRSGSSSGGSSGGSGSSGGGKPLHDVHCKVIGPAAFDLLQTFIHRWDHHPDHVRLDRTSGALLGRAEPIPTRITSPGRLSSTGQTSSVCIARTFNPVTPGTTLRRERDIQNLLVASIRNARRFIYLEDQYLIHPLAAAELRAAVPRLEHLTILIAASELSDLPCVWKLRREFVARLTAGLSSRDRAKVRLFILVSPPASTPPTFGRHTYVHAKIWVFDDELAVIGSANCNRRGWEHDSEVNAFIFDDRSPAAGGQTFAQKLRQHLWAEHLNVSPAVVTDGVASARLWLSPPAGARIMPYNPTAARDRIPDSVCNTMLGTIDPVP